MARLIGQELLVIPKNVEERPAKHYLSWHNENVCLG